MNYRLDDLQVNNLRIYQLPDKYCFSTDPVILAHFAMRGKINDELQMTNDEWGLNSMNNCGREELQQDGAIRRDNHSSFVIRHSSLKKINALDLGSGSGILPILLVGKYGCAACDGVELQDSFVKMSAESVRLNRLDDRIRIHAMRIQDAPKKLNKTYDLVVSNPPFSKKGDGAKNLDESLAIARHEVEITLEELVTAASRLVKFGGRFCLIHQAERLGEICASLSRHGFAAKRIRPVAGRVGANPSLVLVEAKRGAAEGLIMERTLELYFANGTETEELKQIYGRVVPHGE